MSHLTKRRIVALTQALREALDCITLGLGNPEPDKLQEWNAVLNDTDKEGETA